MKTSITKMVHIDWGFAKVQHVQNLSLKYIRMYLPIWPVGLLLSEDNIILQKLARYYEVYIKNVENIICRQFCPKIILNLGIFCERKSLLDGNYFLDFSICSVEQSASGS